MRISLEQIINEHNELRERCCKLAKENGGERMGSYAWLRGALTESDITLQYGEGGIRCFGHTYTSQTWDHEWFEFEISVSDLATDKLREELANS